MTTCTFRSDAENSTIKSSTSIRHNICCHHTLSPGVVMTDVFLRRTCWQGCMICFFECFFIKKSLHNSYFKTIVKAILDKLSSAQHGSCRHGNSFSLLHTALFPALANRAAARCHLHICTCTCKRTVAVRSAQMLSSCMSEC